MCTFYFKEESSMYHLKFFNIYDRYFFEQTPHLPFTHVVLLERHQIHMVDICETGKHETT